MIYIYYAISIIHTLLTYGWYKYHYSFIYMSCLSGKIHMIYILCDTHIMWYTHTDSLVIHILWLIHICDMTQSWNTYETHFAWYIYHITARKVSGNPAGVDPVHCKSAHGPRLTCYWYTWETDFTLELMVQIKKKTGHMLENPHPRSVLYGMVWLWVVGALKL